MSLQTLIELLPQPKSEFVESITEEGWKDIESRIGTELPNDYKSFVSRCGTCLLGSFIFVCSPYYDYPTFNLLKMNKQWYDTMTGIRDDFPEYFGMHRFFPEPTGLLAWGKTETAHYLSWKTQGQPNDWTVAIFDGRGNEYYEFDMNFSSFLYQYLSGSFNDRALLSPPNTDSENLFFHLRELPPHNNQK